MNRIRFLRPARTELAEAMEYYESRQIGLGDAFLSAVEAAVEQISDMPHSGQPLSLNTRRWIAHRFPYQLIYSIEVEEIVIVAVAHLHRKLGYWQDRL